MPIIAEEYQFVIGVDTHAASHAFAVVTAVNGAVILNPPDSSVRRPRDSWSPSCGLPGRPVRTPRAEDIRSRSGVASR